MTDIVKYPDVFLRTVSLPVKFPLDDKTERLIKWMIKIMYKNYGVGLAAVQVGYQRRIFVMDCTRSGDNPQVFINPEIVEKSDETLRDTEGWLSAPGRQGDVKRHMKQHNKRKCDEMEKQNEEDIKEEICDEAANGNFIIHKKEDCICCKQ